jgi:hypothetical protein
MRKTKLSFNLFAQQHGNDGLFARFYRQTGSAILLQKQVSKASIAKIVGISLPTFTALSRQGGYAHTLKGYFYTNLGGTLVNAGEAPHVCPTARGRCLSQLGALAGPASERSG